MTMTTTATPPKMYAVLLPPPDVVVELVMLELSLVMLLELVLLAGDKVSVWTIGWTRVEVCE